MGGCGHIGYKKLQVYSALDSTALISLDLARLIARHIKMGWVKLRSVNAS